MNSMDTTWHKAFLLHRRDYRETSLIADFFTLDQGIVSGVVKGGRRPHKTAKWSLQPFTLLNINWIGSGELKTIKAAESFENALPLVGQQLFCGFYINELLLRLLNRYDPYLPLFHAYELVLRQLRVCEQNQTDIVLRLFEKKLLSVLGYGFNFIQDSDGVEIKSSTHYVFESERGFVPLLAVKNKPLTSMIFRGELLQAIEQDDYTLLETRHAAKQLMRSALGYYLGNKPLNSRQLFLTMKKDVEL